MAWYANMDSYLISYNFVHWNYNPNVYMLRMVDSLLLLVLYVDDLLIIDLLIIDFWTLAIVAIKRIMHDRLLMMEMGPLHFYLGLEIKHDALGIKLSHTMYA
jgi:hypothetical protein